MRIATSTSDSSSGQDDAASQTVAGAASGSDTTDTPEAPADGGFSPAAGERPTRRFPGFATITVQGGGLFGLALLGQLQAIWEHPEILPVAYLGNSAGGIVATLAWGRVEPAVAREHIAKIAGGARPSELVSLLEPFEEPGGPGFTFRQMRKRLERLKEPIRTLSSDPNDVGRRRRWAAYASLACNVIGLPKLARRLWNRMGVFSGARLEVVIDELLRAGGRYLELAGPKPTTPIGLGMFPKDELPALLLTSFDLANGKLELLRSFDDRFAAMPAAAAARASGAFPIFFRPVQQKVGSAIHRFVDGGIVTNFPLWATGSVRRWLDDDVHPVFARMPIIHFGLRRGPGIRGAVIDDDGASFASLIANTLTEGTRDLYEDQVERSLRHAWIVRQPLADLQWPHGFLDFDKVTANGVRYLFDRGYEWARRELEGFDLKFPDDERDDIHRILDDLTARVADIAGSLQVRVAAASALLPNPDGLLVLAYGRAGGVDDPRVDAGTSFAVDSTALPGTTFSAGEPALAPDLTDAEQVRMIVVSTAASAGGAPSAAARLKNSRSLVLAVPIFADRADEPPSLLPDIEAAAGEVPRARYGILCLEVKVPSDGTGVLDLNDLTGSRSIGGMVDIMEKSARHLAMIIVPAAMGRRKVR